MIIRYLRALLPGTLILLGYVFSISPGWAQAPVATNVDSRVVLAFRVGEAKLQSWLPEPWVVNPVAAGPSKDATLLISS